MKTIVHHIFAFFLHLGGFGLLGIGVLDSSFMFTPFGNDLLVVGLSARSHFLMPYYAAMAAVGSVCGSLLIDIIGRKGGEEGLRKRVSRRRFRYLQNRISRHAVWALSFSALMPPPFPYTLFIAAAAAFGYPRRKLLGVVAASRFARFFLEGLLAIFFGEKVLGFVQMRGFEYVIIALIVVSILGSAVSVYAWVRRSSWERILTHAHYPEP